jgi:hypothetical protein
MTLPEPWIELPISSEHDRKSFDCGEPVLNDYLHRYARQNHQSGGAKCFVAVDRKSPRQVLGFYTLSPASLLHARTPKIVRRGLGRYDVPVFRLGRLAVGVGMQGRGLGGSLLLAAGERALRVATEVGGVALLIDAKDGQAAGWYRAHGALPLLDNPLSLLLPLKSVAAALQIES